LNENSKRTQATSSGDKIRNYRELLPDYMNAKFPSDLAQLCAITYKLDEYLSKLISKPKTKNNSESFANVKSFFEVEH